jgi:hypothetical protein
MRVLALADQLGHVLMAEKDRRISLLRRLLQHSEATARYNVYFGDGRDSMDERGRVVHESIFNLNDGSYRCPSTQQGYSPFSTWTRGQAWILCGYAELLEFLDTVRPEEISALSYQSLPDLAAAKARFLSTARAVADHYMANTPTCGVPYWDTGAPGLAAMGDYQDRPADPYNEREPVDSSAAAISAQGLLRLGQYLGAEGSQYLQAGLAVSKTLLSEVYISRDPSHQGILLHSVYHRPNGWDYVAKGQKIPNGESCMWGDYHMMELAAYILRAAEDRPYLSFFSI